MSHRFKVAVLPEHYLFSTRLIHVFTPIVKINNNISYHITNTLIPLIAFLFQQFHIHAHSRIIKI